MSEVNSLHGVRHVPRALRNGNGIRTLPASPPGQASARLTMGRFGNLALSRKFASPAAVGMGAALHFPLADAAVPASEDQVEKGLRFCEASMGVRALPLQARLRTNLLWAEYLRSRAEPTRAAAPNLQPTQDVRGTASSSRGRLPPLPPVSSMRVGL